jgi:hypothetical protein
MARTNTVLVNLKGTGDSCKPTRSISGLWQSAGVRPTAIFWNGNGACESRSSELFAAHVQGAPIELSSLPQLELIEVGDGPLRLTFYGFGGVPFYPASEENLSTGPFIEAASGEHCWPQWFEDKTWRCVPSSFYIVANSDVYYESEGCTGARAYFAPTEATCLGAPEPRGLVLLDLQNWSPREGFPIIETLEFGAAFSQTSVFRGSDLSSACQNENVFGGPSLVRMNALDPTEIFVPIERKLKY